MRVVMATWGRFHSFHLARRLYKDNWLAGVFTTFPKFALRREQIPDELIFSNPWIHTPMMAKARIGWVWPRIDGSLYAANDWLQQRYIANRIPDCDALFALSGSGLSGGRVVQKRGGIWLCERTSSHISTQLRLVQEEHRRWSVEPFAVTQWAVRKEIAEYDEADVVVVPSTFVKQTFLDEGVPEHRLRVVPLGTSMAQFERTGEPSAEEFRVLFVGQISLRKGFPYLLNAFRRVKHPNKKLVVIGGIGAGMKPVLDKLPSDRVEYLGTLPHAELKHQFSRAHAFVLPSIEEGLANVMGEALACGCPVIASENTGARDRFSDGVEGFIIPIRDEDAIVDRLERLAQDPDLQKRMSASAVAAVQARGGWDDYTTRVKELIVELLEPRRAQMSKRP
jgi:glycosyltransferase involved in cell wall biosynthesis